jgi:hypothetical protein
MTTAAAPQYQCGPSGLGLVHKLELGGMLAFTIVLFVFNSGMWPIGLLITLLSGAWLWVRTPRHFEIWPDMLRVTYLFRTDDLPLRNVAMVNRSVSLFEIFWRRDFWRITSTENAVLLDFARPSVLSYHRVRIYSPADPDEFVRQLNLAIGAMDR